jgi:transketolase C-terminal domain/subunit
MDLGMKPHKFFRFGLENKYSSIVGSQQYLRHKYGMDSKAIVKKVLNLLGA